MQGIKTCVMYEFDGVVLPLEGLEYVVHGASPNPKPLDRQIKGTLRNNNRYLGNVVKNLFSNLYSIIEGTFTKRVKN
jgi:hypothetical protein